MIKRIMPLAVVVCLLVACLSVSASAAIFDPYENGTVTVDGNLELVTVKIDTSGMFWQRFHDGSPSFNCSGDSLTYQTQMRYVDNDTVSCWPFGITNYIETSGIPTGSSISVNMAIGLNIANQSQNFECVGYLYLDTYDSQGLNISRTTVWSETQNPVVDSNVFFVETNIDTAMIQGSNKWCLVFSFDFNGVSNENDITSVTLQCFGDNISIVVPYSQLYQLQAQGAKTNKLLDQIDKQMVANGEKLDDVIKEQQAIKDEIDNAVNGEVPPVKPDGSGEVDDFHDKEEELWGSVSGGTQHVAQVVLGAGSVIRDLATPFVVAASICNILWTRDPFWDLLYVSLALGVVASILGLGVYAARSSSGKSKGGKK